ncbi:hypothetical protein [Actinoplanes sp. G11-F43]|uniref:hypothetical protein n=1 Tax=Actinoplanes sp. G11-F43 TaxID=3424130 RepID=UPI003D33B48C
MTSQRLAALFGFPEPEYTEEQERAFQERMDRGDDALVEIFAGHLTMTRLLDSGQDERFDRHKGAGSLWRPR